MRKGLHRGQWRHNGLCLPLVWLDSWRVLDDRYLSDSVLLEIWWRCDVFVVLLWNGYVMSVLRRVPSWTRRGNADDGGMLYSSPTHSPG